jgi:hypothetical protein
MPGTSTVHYLIQSSRIPIVFEEFIKQYFELATVKFRTKAVYEFPRACNVTAQPVHVSTHNLKSICWFYVDLRENSLYLGTTTFNMEMLLPALGDSLSHNIYNPFPVSASEAMCTVKELLVVTCFYHPQI